MEEEKAEMEDFGEAHFVLSLKLTKTLLLCESREMPGYFYTFTKNKSKILADGKTESIYYSCSKCRPKGRKVENGCRVTVVNGRIKTDPDANHNMFCHPLTKGEAEKLQVVREFMIPNSTTPGKKPRDVYNEACIEMERRGVSQSEIPSYNSVKSMIYRRNLEANPRPKKFRTPRTKRPTGQNASFTYGQGQGDYNFSYTEPTFTVENANQYPHMDSSADRSVATTIPSQPGAPGPVSNYLSSHMGTPHQQGGPQQQVTGHVGGAQAPTVAIVHQELRQFMQALNKTKLSEEFAKAILVKMKEIKVLYQTAEQMNRNFLEDT